MRRSSSGWWVTAHADFNWPNLTGPTFDTEPITQQHLTSMIESVFPSRVDTTIDEWTTAHADLGWAHLTSPSCFLLD